MYRSLRVCDTRDDILGIEIENVRNRDVLYAPWAARRRLFVLAIDMSGEGAFRSVNVVSVESSADLATAIEDNPGGSVSELT
jgi:hypothetical protein